MRVLDDKKGSVDTGHAGPALLDAYVPRNEVPMESISRQRRLVTRDLLQNAEALRAMQDRRKTNEADKD